MGNYNLLNPLKLTLVFFMLLSFDSTSQETIEIEANSNTTSPFDEQAFFDSLAEVKKAAKRLSLKSAISDMFYNGESDGYLHIGITNHFELLHYGLGGEVKLYGSYYHPIASGSIYANYRRLFVEKNEHIPANGVSFGGHYSVFGLEANCYFNQEKALFYLTPKLGYDTGTFSLFYGYSIPIKSIYSRA
jgi:hypothetical protein